MNAFNYKGYFIKNEYGGWAVQGYMFETRASAKRYVDMIIASVQKI